MTLDCPQVDEWLIKALGETLAPFVQPEKPQVFPRPATSFIKKRPGHQHVGADRQAPPSCTARISEKAGGTVMSVLIGIFATI
jgi:hypothetical protein